jgi:hypothetical protein
MSAFKSLRNALLFALAMSGAASAIAQGSTIRINQKHGPGQFLGLGSSHQFRFDALELVG